ncbi:phytanoyl-CoA dioxygenase family protein [Pannus brasiliensis CCIBt3594]|uniref:Phytanoyl-CoA dioxygenase family protein n=1 Tax=Pannus brasiliensis CCIBt3594 TaxID=1427578 RepID=A0AAW9QXH4_9CHRO
MNHDKTGLTLSAEQIESFDRDGFLVLERFLDRELVERLAGRFDPLFSGEFDTGIYPDEWYWRTGMSLSDVTRHMGNVWKSDRTIAGVVLSAEIARIVATLAGWSGARMGQDTLWMKPPKGKEIAFHQDATYVSYLDPPLSMTCWLTLDDTRADGGTIEYVRGSHRWPLVERPGDFHAPERWYRYAMEEAASALGITDLDIVAIEVPAGSAVIHHGYLWHGSGPNRRSDTIRRSLGVHLLPDNARFQPTGASYIFGRYKRVGDTMMDENFFPILWTAEGYRSPFLADYCPDALTRPLVTRA